MLPKHLLADKARGGMALLYIVSSVGAGLAAAALGAYLAY